MNNYTVLHCHSHFSLLDGLSKPSRIAERIKDIDANGCAITDHGSISCAVSFLKEMKKVNKKPILGLEAYICDEDASIKTTENRALAHLPILAKNTKGWQSLVRLVSESNKPEHYYHRPRLSLQQLSQYSNGDLIGFSGHLGSHISNSIVEYGIEGGVKTAKILEKCFGKGNFWLECQLMDQKVTPEQIKITKAVREISKITGIPCIATPDAHYAYKQDAILQRILLCSNMGVNLEKGRHPDFGMNTFFLSDCFHIPSYDEMLEYGHTEEELENTNIILSQVEEYDILKAPMLKKFNCPNNRTPDEHLKQLCRDGWVKLIANKIPSSEHKIYADRVKDELDILQTAGLSSYFLIIQDILKFVTGKGWLPGISRGSAGGCLVSYLVGITQIDPIKHNLLFSRFYSAARQTKDHISLPDIDVDVPIHVRQEVISYIKEKYGNEYVSQMATFQTMKGARALKEVFRAYGDISFEEINEITKNIVDEAKISDQLEEMENPSIIRWCLENKPKDFKQWCQIDEDGKLIGEYSDRFELAIKLEGTKSAQSKHAAGIIVSPQPLSEVCPMIYDSKNKTQIAGMEMDDLESLGLMKLDILGIAALSKLMEIQKINPDFNPDPLEINFDDDSTWDLLSEGNTKGVFQLESRLGQSYSKKLQPSNIDHLAGLTALLRPGCISKGTKIVISHNDDGSRNRYRKIKIEDLYETFKRNNNSFNKQIISYDDKNHELLPNKIEKIWYNGIRDVYSINFKTRFRQHTQTSKLHCTFDHPIFVANKGWTRLEDMKKGDRFLILSNSGMNPTPVSTAYRNAHKNLCFYNYKYECLFCDWDKASLDVNHIEGNRYTNNDIDNLCFLCPNHHRMYTENILSKEQIIAKQEKLKLNTDNNKLRWAHFIDINFVAKQDVYDIQVEGPHHNFLAGDIVVHNCLQTQESNGKSVTDNYISIKNKQEEPNYITDSLRPILKNTYSKNIYQEQSMRIATVLAGFTEEEADQYIRKGIGKKKADLIQKAKIMFMKGCAKKKTIDEPTAKEIFASIESSARYQFNASHAYGYSYLSYITAYAKQHFPREFFTAYLKYAKNNIKPQKEIYELVNNAKAMGIFIMPPNIKKKNSDFELIGSDIFFGLCDIKNVGQSVMDKLEIDLVTLTAKTKKNFDDWTWVEFLLLIAPKIKINSLESMINVGACDCFDVSRTEMLFQTNIMKEFSSRELQWIEYNLILNNNYKGLGLKNILELMVKSTPGRKGACSNKNRLLKIENLLVAINNPPYSMDDKPHQISQLEYELLGVNITATNLDECKTRYKANCSCLEFNQGFAKDGGKIIIASNIDMVRKIKTKRGKNPGQEMAFIEASDETGSLNCIVIFPDCWLEYKNMIVEGNNLLLCGRRNDDNTSFILELVEQL